MLKHYGKLIPPHTNLTDEEVLCTTTGIIKEGSHYQCQQCNTVEPHHFSHYFSEILQQDIIYCRHCLPLGRMDNVTYYQITKSKRQSSAIDYTLPFNLSAQQQFASNKIISAITERHPLLLYAVTGAGKTEMMFEGIKQARRQGDNVAIVSPRVDVVLEISQRIKQSFTEEHIDVLHQQSTQTYAGHFVIATVHQLWRFKNHFDVVFVDEVDAFPLSMDQSLQQALLSASKTESTHIYMTATPPKRLLHHIPSAHIIKLPARFHRKPLPIPRYRYFNLKPHQIQRKLLSLLQHQIAHERYTLVFFNHIEQMIQTYHSYKEVIPLMTYVHSEDALRFERVSQLRQQRYRILFTTTILERGFTMAQLDVIVIDAHLFTKSALIQIAGRVGRKMEAPDGMVLFLHRGVSINMILAKRDMVAMNRLAIKRGWIDG